MPKLTVDGYGTFDVPADKRLVLAIEQDAGVDILHACGGNARCTTCRVEFIDGEPSTMTVAEKERLAARELTGVRLSCQILCDHDMAVRAISRLEGSGRPDPGKTPEADHHPSGAVGVSSTTPVNSTELHEQADASAQSELEREVARRRTFAIISHPDAGKTTLTEKLLLYAGAIELAGAVRGRKARKHATSDWMALEQERGISITAAALEFELDGRRMALLDTPGHKDFSEDTYRALIAADSVVMVIDAANGVEEQTRKLFEVCRRHRLPILTFVNKFDRPARDPLELLDDIERTLGISAAPVNWPVGNAEHFRGVYDIAAQHLLLYEREAQGQYRAPVDVSRSRRSRRARADRRERLRALPRVARRDPRRRHAPSTSTNTSPAGRRRCSSAAR